MFFLAATHRDHSRRPYLGHSSTHPVLHTSVTVESDQGRHLRTDICRISSYVTMQWVGGHELVVHVSDSSSRSEKVRGVLTKAMTDSWRVNELHLEPCSMYVSSIWFGPYCSLEITSRVSTRFLDCCLIVGLPLTGHLRGCNYYTFVCRHWR